MDKASVIGFDQGFSSCKVSTEWGDFKFPNAVEEISRAGTIGGSFLDNTSEIKTYFYNGKYYLVGDDARSDKGYNRDINYLLEYAPLLLAVAIDKIYSLYGVSVSKEFVISAGLPIDFNSYSKEYKRLLSNFSVNNNQYHFDNVVINGQGVGVFADYVYNWCENKSSLYDEEGIVLDIGENTIIVIHYKNGKILKDITEQFNKYGVSSIMDGLGDALKRRFNGRVFNASEIRKAFINKTILQAGKNEDISQEIALLEKKYLEETFSFLVNKYENYFLSINKIILAGGGGSLLNSFLSEYDTSKIGNFIISPSVEFSNSRGYRAKAIKNYC